jgi:hypothetical protein
MQADKKEPAEAGSEKTVISRFTAFVVALLLREASAISQG